MHLSIWFYNKLFTASSVHLFIVICHSLISFFHVYKPIFGNVLTQVGNNWNTNCKFLTSFQASIMICSELKYRLASPHQSHLFFLFAFVSSSTRLTHLVQSRTLMCLLMQKLSSFLRWLKCCMHNMQWKFYSVHAMQECSLCGFFGWAVAADCCSFT